MAVVFWMVSVCWWFVVWNVFVLFVLTFLCAALLPLMIVCFVFVLFVLLLFLLLFFLWTFCFSSASSRFASTEHGTQTRASLSTWVYPFFDGC